MTDKETAIEYVNDLRLSEYFSLMKKNFGATPEISRLELAYTLNKTDAEFYEQAKTLAGLLFDRKETINYCFNELLMSELLQAMLPHQPVAQKFWERAKTVPDWRKNPQVCSKSKEIIAYYFIGAVGSQLSKLWAIGVEELVEKNNPAEKSAFDTLKRNKYLKQCIFTGKRTLDIIIIALISTLWDAKKKGNLTVSEVEQTALNNFFEATFESDFGTQLSLLQNLNTIFAANSLPLPFPEMTKNIDYLRENSEFCLAVQAAQKAEREISDATLEDCKTIEKTLAAILKPFAFLTAYKMNSVKTVFLHQIRDQIPHFITEYSLLSIGASETKRYEFAEKALATQSVLIFKEDNPRESINLFPFVVDYGALNLSDKAQIAFYVNKDVMDGALQYILLEDCSVRKITFQDIQNKTAANEMHKIFGNNDNLKIFYQDTVANIFSEASNAMTSNAGNSLNFDNFNFS